MGIYPLTGWQEHLLVYETDPVKNAAMLRSVTLNSVLHVKPALNMRRLRRAFKAMCARHDITRSQFRKLGGQWKCSILDNTPDAITEHDYSGIEEDRIDGVLTHHARQMIGMFDAALVRLDVLHFGALGCGVILRAHHAITDGFGMNLLLGALLKGFVGTPSLAPALSHVSYMQKWGADTQPYVPENERFWEQKLLPPAEPLNIGRIKRGMPILTNTYGWRRYRNIGYDLTASDATRIESLSRDEKTTPFMLMTAAFLTALAEVADSDEALYSTTLGRSERELSNYAGHHTLHPFMRSRNLRHETLGGVARASMQELAATIDHLPAPAGRRSGWWDQRLLAAGGYPRQISSGSPNPNALSKGEAGLMPVALTAGAGFEIGPYALRKVPMVRDAGDMDELVLRPYFGAKGGPLYFNYDVDAYDDAEIIHLADRVFDRIGIAPPRGDLLDTADEASALTP